MRNVESTDPIVPGDDAVDPAVGRGRMPWTSLDSWAMAAITALCLVIVGLFVSAYPTLSPIDELQHIDYAIKAGHLDFVGTNERVGQEAMLEAACRSVDAPGYAGPACDPAAVYDPNSFQERGVNTASGANPPFYVITGVGGRIIRALTPIASIVGAMRLMGAFWMTLSFGLVWYLMAEFGIGRAQRAVVIGLMTATPQVVVGFSTINVDSVIIPGSVLVMIAALRFDQRLPRSGEFLAVAAVVSIGLEVTNVFAVLAVGTYLALRSVPQAGAVGDPGAWLRALRDRGWVGPALGAAAFPIVLLLGKVHQLLIAPEAALDFDLPRNVVHAAGQGYITPDLLMSRIGALVTPVSRPYVPEILGGQITSTILQLTAWTLIGGTLAATLLAPRRSRVALATSSAVVWLLVAGPLITYQRSGLALSIPARYGLPLLPLALVGVAYSLHKTSAVVVVGALAAFANVYVVYRLA